MPAFMKNQRLLWILAAAMVVALVGTVVVLTAHDRPRTTFLERLVGDLLLPFQVVIDWTADSVRGSVEGVRAIVNLKDDNRRLKAELEHIRALEVQNQELAAENAELRRQLELAQRTPYRLLPAQVVARHPETWFKAVTLNRGERHGVQEGMAVINHQGMLGRVARVTASTALVQLLIEPGSGVGVMEVNSRQPGTLTASAGFGLKVQFFNRDAAVAPGDRIVTSGLGIGSAIPRGLFIGTIEEVGWEQGNLVRYATVRPAVDFSLLGGVMVVLGLPPEAGFAP